MLRRPLSHKCLLTTLCLLLLPQLLLAWNVEELQMNAASSRDQVLSYQARLLQQQAQVRQQNAAFLPQLDLYYSESKLRDETVYEYDQTHRRGIRLSWNLFNGFTDYYQRLGASQRSEMRQLQVRQLQHQLQQQVTRTCLDLSTQQRNLEVSRRAVELYDQEWHNAQTQFEVGLITRNDVLKIEVERENARLQQNSAEIQLQNLLTLLRQQSGVEQLTLNNLDLNAFAVLPTLDEIQLPQLDHNPELLALQSLIDAAASDHRALRGRWLPKADLSSDLYRSDEVQEEGDEQIKTQLTLSMNLFEGGATRARQQEAYQFLQQCRYDYRERAQQLRVELSNRQRELALARNNLQVAAISLEQARENLRITRLAFEQGLTTSAEVLDAIFVHTRAERNVISARSDIFAATLDIRLLTGDYATYAVQ
ncbi:MAG: TolC family protein [Desulfuromonadaceae bacterium]|nr:TolC family protein [Desulfuromonadaceae bacterium]